MNPDTAIVLMLIEQRTRIAVLEQENAELRAALDAGPHLTARPVPVRDPA